MSTPPYFELRLYQCVPGRIPDLHKRMTVDVPPIFSANGVSLPLISWIGYAGLRSPLYSYLLRWDDLDARMGSFGRFYKDPAWLAHRAASNAGREMVERIDVFILRPAGPVSDFSLTAAPCDRLHEIRLQQVMARDVAAGMRAWQDHDLPLLEGHGCCNLGTFTMWYGTRMPQIVSLLTWPGFDARTKAFAALDAEDSRRPTRHDERVRFGRPIFDRAENPPCHARRLSFNTMEKAACSSSWDFITANRG